MAQIADGYVLADVKAEVTAAGGQHECARDRWGPDDLAVHQALDMFQHRLSMVPRLAEPGIVVGAKQKGIGPFDDGETELAKRLGNGIRVVPNVGRQGRRRIAGALTHAFDAGS